jgi:dihydrofolate synthase / folylpolyglutamate synthase
MLTPEQAESRLLSLELFGMRFGLDRMRRLMTALGHPERSFQSIHVVGTNGKSSTTRMTAAILARHGYRVGTYLSPHLISFNERIRIDDQDITAQEFADAIERALDAAETVNRDAPEDDHVTQFELLTAAAYSELARREVDIAVIEAGLGGHYDATNVIPSSVQILTGVNLEHTRWLGSTVTAIAGEKLDVVQPGATLVLGPDMHPDALAVARRVADERHATIIQADSDPHAHVGALGTFQRRNFAVARAAAEAFLAAQQPPRPLQEAKVVQAAADTRVPGRLQVVASEPLTLLDGAHNPDGIAALAESLPEIIASANTSGEQRDTADVRPGQTVLVVSILEDKDAATMLSELLPIADRIVLTANQNPRALPPPTLKSLISQIGADEVEKASIVGNPHEALTNARKLAGPTGVVVATGSIYLIADLLAGKPGQQRRRASTL